MCVKLRAGAGQVRHLSHLVSLVSQGISLSRYDLDASETLFVAGEGSFVAKWCLICLTRVSCRYDFGVCCETGESPDGHHAFGQRHSLILWIDGTKHRAIVHGFA